MWKAPGAETVGTGFYNFSPVLDPSQAKDQRKGNWKWGCPAGRTKRRARCQKLQKGREFNKLEGVRKERSAIRERKLPLRSWRSCRSEWGPGPRLKSSGNESLEFRRLRNWEARGSSGRTTSAVLLLDIFIRFLPSTFPLSLIFSFSPLSKQNHLYKVTDGIKFRLFINPQFNLTWHLCWNAADQWINFWKAFHPWLKTLHRQQH